SSVVRDSEYSESLVEIQRLEDRRNYKREIDTESIAGKPPVFAKTLRNIETTEEANVHLECRLEPSTGDIETTIEWFKNGQPITVGHRFRPQFDFDFIALDIHCVYPEDSGLYTCKARNIFGETVSSCQLLCHGKSQRVIYETEMSDSFMNARHLEETKRKTRKDVTEIDDEIQRTKPKFLTKFRNLELQEFQSAHIECRIEPVNDPNLTVEWFYNGNPLPVVCIASPTGKGHRFQPFYDFGYIALKILQIIEEDSGVYTCRITNKSGSDELSATIICHGRASIDRESQFPDTYAKTKHLEERGYYTRDSYVDDMTKQAPVFTTAPKNRDVTEGDGVHFECQLTPIGDPTLKVEWFKNGEPLLQGSRFVEIFDFGFVALDIRHAYAEDSGRYTIRAVNDYGEATTQAFLKCRPTSSLITTSQLEGSLSSIRRLERKRERVVEEEEAISEAPVFTQPMRNLRLIENQSAHFETRLIPVGDSDMCVEWFHNGSPLMLGSRMSTINDFGYVALDFKYVKPSDSGTFTCKASNRFGGAVCSATLHVEDTKSIVSDTSFPDSVQKISCLEGRNFYRKEEITETTSDRKPYFVTELKGPNVGEEGKSAHFECRIEPFPDETMTVEWLLNGHPLQIGNRYRTLFDFGFAALDVMALIPEDSGDYEIKATNHLGFNTSKVTLKVVDRGSVLLDSIQPSSLSKIRALETPRRVKRQDDDTIFVDKPEFGNSLRNYENLKEGEPFHLEATLTPADDPTMRVEWLVNGVPLQTGHRFKSLHDFGFVALDVLYAYPEDSGTYMCRAVNEAGEAVTTGSILVEQRKVIDTDTIHEESLQQIQALERPHVRQRLSPQMETCRPVFTKPLKNLENLREGQSAHLECRLEPINDPSMTVEWFLNGTPLKTGHRFRLTNDFGYIALDILYAYPEDTGTYMVRATNDLGEAVITCTISVTEKRSIIYDTINPDGLERIQYLERQTPRGLQEVEERPPTEPMFLSKLKGTTRLHEGQRAHFECRVEPSYDPQLEIEFLHNGKTLISGSRYHTFSDFGYVSLDIAYVYPEDSGSYSVRASNLLGEVITSINLTVEGKSSIQTESMHSEALPKLHALETEYRYTVQEEVLTFQRPVFTTPLRNIDNVLEADAAHFEAKLIPVGDPTLEVQWYHNNTPLKTGSRFITMNDFGYVALDILQIQPEDAGVYTAHAVNSMGEADTKSIVSDTSFPDSVQKISCLEGRNFYRKEEITETTSERKPYFVTELKGPNVGEEGKSAHFECRIEPFPDQTMTVEWLLNGHPLQIGNRYRTLFDFGFAALDVMALIPEDSGDYEIKATNHLGFNTSKVTLKVVDRGSVLLDSIQPSSLSKIRALETPRRVKRQDDDTIFVDKPEFGNSLRNYENLKEGEPFHLEATLTPADDPTMRVEWLVNGVPLQTGHRFKSLHDFGFVALDVLYAYPEDSGTYMCRAVNEAGEAVTTGSIRVEQRKVIDTDTIHEESLQQIAALERPHVRQRLSPQMETCRPVFTKPLKNIENLREGQSAHLECRLEPINDPSMTVEWFLNETPLKTGHRFRLTNDFGYIALDILYAYPEDTGTYMVRATNDLGEAVITCTISVTEKRSIIYDTINPDGLERIQYLERQTPRGLQEVEERPPTEPMFLSKLKGTTRLHEGQRAHFECRVEPSYDPQLEIEFLHNGKTLISGSRYHTFCDFGYVSLDIAYVYPEDSGSYSVKASNLLGEVITSINLTVEGKSSIQTESMHSEALPKLHALETEYRYTVQEEVLTFQRPVFTTPLRNIDNVLEADAAHFEAKLIPVGDPTLEVQWYHNNTPLKTGSRFITMNDFGYVALDILQIQPEDAGVYTAHAVNSMGEAVTTATMRVNSAVQIHSQHPEGLQQIQALERSKYMGPREEPEQWFEKPIFTTPLVGPHDLIEGQAARFECRAVPVGDPDLDFIWYLNGKELLMGSRIATSHDFGYVCLDIASTVPEDSGVYMIKAINRSGEAITSVSLRVKALSTIDMHCQHPEAFRQTQVFETDIRTTVTETTEEIYERPVFTRQLSSIKDIKEGDYVFIEAQIEPSNDDKLIVEWHKNGQYLVLGSRITTRFDFGLISLEIMDIKAEDSGIYTCRAVNDSGEAISTCTLKVKGSENLDFRSLHPESWQRIQEFEAFRPTKAEIPEFETELPNFVSHLNDLNLKEGETAHFECRVEPSSDPTMKYEILRNGEPMPSGSRYSVTHDFGYVSVDIAYVYPEDSGVYTCRASNPKGQSVSTASLKVVGKGLIDTTTLHPTGQQGLERIKQLETTVERVIPAEAKPEFTKPYFVIPLKHSFKVNESEGLHLECRVEPSNDLNLCIEWLVNGQPLTSGSRFATTSDFGFIVMDIHDLWTRDTGVYTCRATNQLGEAFTSTQIDVIAKGVTSGKALQPDDKTAQKSDRQSDEDFEAIQVPKITLVSKHMTDLTEGQSAHIEASLAPMDDTSMTVEWLFKGEPLQASNRINTIHSFGYIILEIFNIRTEDSGTYTCVAANDCGTDALNIDLECIESVPGERPHFISQMQSVEGLKEGQSVHFECQLEPVGDPNLTVEWYHNSVILTPSSRIKVVTDFGYVVMDISYVHSEDSGEYVCVASNKYGSDTTKFNIQCSPTPKVDKHAILTESMGQIHALEGYANVQSMGQIVPTTSQSPKFLSPIKELPNLVEGQSAHFETQLVPINDPEMVIEWYMNGEPLRSGQRFRAFNDFGFVVLDILDCDERDSGVYELLSSEPLRSGQRFRAFNDFGFVVLDILDCDERDSGVYECVATNSFGSDKVTTSLKCKPKPKVILESQLPVSMARGIKDLIDYEESLNVKPIEYMEEYVYELPRFEAPLENVANLKEGDGLHIETRITPTDDPNLTIEWLKNGQPLRASNRIRTISDFGFVVLEINPVYSEDSGLYSVRASNNTGEAVMTCNIKCQSSRKVVLETQLPDGSETTFQKLSQFEETVERQVSDSWTTIEEQPPKFLSQLKDIAINENDFVHFESRLVPVSDPTMKVEWFLNDKPLTTGSRFRTISDFGYVVLEIAETYPRDSGLYVCKAVNMFGVLR
ncbi:unnamed protein product, partial [Medioppia subpectinata]